MKKCGKRQKCGKSGESTIDKVVLVGTYKKGQLEWIGKSGIYNCPIKDDDKMPPEAFGKIVELWLYLGTKGVRTVKAASFRGIMSRDEFLAEFTDYPKGKGKPYSDRYAVFEVKDKAENRYSKLKAQALPEDMGVIVRFDDFKARTPAISKAIKAYQDGGEFGNLLDYLPADLSAIPRNQLRVFESWMQMSFFAELDGEYQVTTSIKYSFVDLFAGCGGLSLGMEKAGFTPVLVNELNNDALSTYLLNRQDEFPWLREHNVNNVKDLVLKPKLLKRFTDSIRDKLNIDCEKGELDLLCGGPPCQGFSGIGHRRSYSVEKAQLPSNYLFQDMAFLINKLQPKIFLFENVRGLLTSKWTKDGENGEIFKMVLETFHRIGKYNICYKLVHAKDYGVPQNRPRILIVGLRKDVFPDMTQNNMDAVIAGFLPEPTGGAPDLKDLLGDLVDPNHQNGGCSLFYATDPLTEIQKEFRTKRDGALMGKGSELSEQEYSKHAPKILAKFRAMHENGGIIPDEFKTKKFSQRLLPAKWGENGPSITACSAPDDYVHFAQPRGLTVREWARLQMFPDWYQFAGPRTTGGLRRAGNPREGIFDRELPKYTQIGNAVPVGLSYRIGQHFMRLLEKRNVKGGKRKN